MTFPEPDSRQGSELPARLCKAPPGSANCCSLAACHCAYNLNCPTSQGCWLLPAMSPWDKHQVSGRLRAERQEGVSHHNQYQTSSMFPRLQTLDTSCIRRRSSLLIFCFNKADFPLECKHYPEHFDSLNKTLILH